MKIEIFTVLSVAAFFVISRATTPREYRLGWLIQWLAQPFWLAVTFLAGQWFMFGVSCFFLAIATHGVMRFNAEVNADAERTVK